MNDGDYPRAQQPLDFDLMASDYRPGDRSRREDDRYLLLEALLSARDQLYVSWVGRSIRDNSERPASVLIGQLRDHLASGWHLAGAMRQRAGRATAARTDPGTPAATVQRALLPEGQPAVQLRPRMAGAAPASTSKSRPRLACRLTDNDEALSLTQLHDFLRHPVRHFFSQRLKVYSSKRWKRPPRTKNPLSSMPCNAMAPAKACWRRAGRAGQRRTGLAGPGRRLQACGLLPLAGLASACRTS